MNCPKCNHDDSKVYQTAVFMGSRVRERACKKCGHLYCTREVISHTAAATLRHAKRLAIQKIRAAKGLPEQKIRGLERIE